VASNTGVVAKDEKAGKTASLSADKAKEVKVRKKE